jgi:uncharacterized protein YbjQ (UPF0145 family)
MHRRKEAIHDSDHDHRHRQPTRNRIRRRRDRGSGSRANVFRDLFAGLRDIVGGRSAGYERSLRQARETAIGEMVAEAEQLGAAAVIGVDVDYESIQIGQGGGMLMVSTSRTAVKL